MDELEISGKRYISTRRAAKQYKYHSDYIGQLIRGKKLLGRKVGRSWYVELESLTTYFGKEGAALVPNEEIAIALENETTPEVKEVKALVIKKEIKNMQVAAAEASEEKKEKEIETITRDSIHIPVRVHRPSFETEYKKMNTTLTYVSDDEPYIPTVKRASHTALSATKVMPRSVEEVEEIVKRNEPEVLSRPSHKRRNIFIPVLSIAALGVIVFIVVVGSSIFVSSSTVIEAGKTANVGYSLQ